MRIKIIGILVGFAIVLNFASGIMTSNGVEKKLTILCSKDSTLRKLMPDVNEGANLLLAIGHYDEKRAVVAFDLSKISIEKLFRASLILTINEQLFPFYFGRRGNPLDVHRLTVDWPEGNGKMLYYRYQDESFYGDGQGVTWHCVADIDISNTSTDCPYGWDGANYAIDPKNALAALITNEMKGEVSWDVTQDILNMLSLGEKKAGFLLKMRNETNGGIINFYSKEGANVKGVPGLTPRLVLVFETKSDLCYSGLYDGLSLDGTELVFPDETDISKLPLCAQWIREIIGSPFVSVVVDGPANNGVALRIVDSAPGYTCRFKRETLYLTGVSSGNIAKLTVRLRIQPGSISMVNNTSGIFLEIDDGTSQIYICLVDDGTPQVGLAEDAGFGLDEWETFENNLAPCTWNDGNYHTFELVRNSDGSASVNIDGAINSLSLPVGALPGSTTGGSYAFFRFGSADSGQSTTYWDEISYEINN
jgi:hypothetical protein